MIAVRSLAAGDYDQWRPLWDGYNAFYGRDGATALAEEITASTWGRFLDAAEPVHALVAERDGQIIGICHYLFHRSTTRLTQTCYLQDLFTDAEARGGGVGRALIEAVSQRAADAGSRDVYWLTHETNTPGRTLYDKVAVHAGFIVYSRRSG
ncbi:GNAT family N-acetyltransferase [Sphingoaurantiacus capsulatus]|uniref:GNAT family N-acetyltransferase n=1 Tax=Sphingoaurantiacus capsulatus TaxID=1771310 RepID=A0ABV7XBL9_9SPHN